MSGFLDKNGLNYFWNKVKSLVSFKQDKVKTYTTTLASTGWAQDSSTGLYAQTVNVDFITATTPMVIVDVSLSGDSESDSDILSAWSGPSSHNAVQGNGTVKFYTDEVPTVNIPIQVGAFL